MGDPRTLLHALAQNRGQSFEAVAREYRTVAKRLGDQFDEDRYRTAEVSEATWRRWTRGGISCPREPASTILMEMYGYSVAQLLGPPVQAMPVIPAQKLSESDIAMTARDAADHAGTAASFQLPDMTLDQLEDDVKALALGYETTQPVSSFRSGEEILARAQEKLERTRMPVQLTRLYEVAGLASSLLAVAAFDLGQFAAATQFARSSAMYGKVASNDQLQAYAYGTLAYLAYWSERPAAAVREVRTARQFGGVGDTGRTRLLSIEARAHAHLGDLQAAHMAIEAALALTSGQTDALHDGIRGEFGFSASRAAMSHASTYLLLGEAEKAERIALDTLQAIEGDPARDRQVEAQLTVDLARARLKAGELDGVEEALTPVLATPTEWRTAGLVDRVSRVRQALTRLTIADASVAQALAERIEDFVAVSAVRPLPGRGTSLSIEG